VEQASQAAEKASEGPVRVAQPLGFFRNLFGLWGFVLARAKIRNPKALATDPQPLFPRGQSSLSSGSK
jgi:hypothetical protein